MGTLEKLLREILLEIVKLSDVEDIRILRLEAGHLVPPPTV